MHVFMNSNIHMRYGMFSFAAVKSTAMLRHGLLARGADGRELVHEFPI